MALKVTSSNGVKVYNCTAGKSTPQWYEDASKKGAKGSLRYNEDFRRRIDLIEDFQFPATSNRIKMSPDGEFIAVTGMYGPQIKMYETSQLSMKFERHIDAEAVEFQFLSSDFRKLALLRADRTIEIHAAYGRHHEVKIPRFGRDILYESANCDLYVAAAGSEIYRLNLEQGRFLAPLQTNFVSADNTTGRKGGVSCGAINPMHHLLAFGGEDKDVVELWDPRDRTSLINLSLSDTLKATDAATAAELERGGAAISSIRFHDTDGLTLAVGTTTGHVLLYDLRSSTPLLAKDHRYGLPIHDIKFHTQTKNVVTSDAKVIKVWNQHSGDVFTNVEPQANINDTCIHPNSGLIMCAGEQPRIQVYYVPSLGPAPKWCSFLDSLTEELEEKTETSLYDDYKFVTREELETWGMEHLIGSNVLKAYMHGFFMDLRLYTRIRSMTSSTPDAYENYMKKRVEEKLKAKTANRIVIKQKLPQVNTAYAQTLLAQPKVKKALKDGAVSNDDTMANPLVDDRFGGIFSNKDFEINPESEEFQRLNPAAFHSLKSKASATSKKRKERDEDEEEENGADDRFDLIDQGEDDDGGDDGAADGSESDDEDYVHKKSGKSSGMAISRLAEKISSKAASAADSITTKKKAPAMYELKQGFTAAHVLDANGAQAAAAKRAKGMTMGERLKFEEAEAARLKREERWGSQPARQPRTESGTPRRGRGGAESGRKGRGMDQLMGRERSGRGGFGEERGGRGGFRGRGGRGRGR